MHPRVSDDRPDHRAAAVPPLLVPPPGYAPAPPGAACPQACCLAPELHVLGDAPATDLDSAPNAPADPDARARYRWKVGHQASIALWQLMNGELDGALASEEGEGEAIGRTARCYDLYSVLLLYAGSCSPQRYADTVRADMAACHPAFSGQWAADYRPLPGLVRRVVNGRPREHTAPLRDAVRGNQRIHAAVAARLVPEGTSLLQEAGRNPGASPTPKETAMFDAFFAVRRGPVCASGLRSQLRYRLALARGDLLVHGLFGPNVPWAAVEPSPDLVQTFASRAVDLLVHHIDDLTAQDAARSAPAVL
ncbi:hypothetical protein ACFXJO_21565 [Streptomyces lavendulae]|uniref:hypothetical protein n=1 Tax=Streptomyces lavendulae TaxID=1914 RepID=UPI0036A0CEBD